MSRPCENSVNFQGQPELAPSGVKRRTRTSAAMIGLALSMGATSLVLPRQSDGAVAAEPQVTEDTVATLPDASAASLPSGIGSTIATAPTAVRFTEHKVREGETLQRLAVQYRVSVLDIVNANRLPLDAVLEVGQTIQIPVHSGSSLNLPQTGSIGSTHESTRESSQLVASSDLSQVPDVSNANIASTANAQVRTDRDSALDRLRQQRDRLKDSLAELRVEESNSAVHSSSVSQPASVALATPAQNKPEEAPVATEVPSVPAQPLVVASSPLPVASPVPEVTPAEAAESQALVAHASTGEGQEQFNKLPSTTVPTTQQSTYRVNPGDTIAAIARAHNIPQSLLINANRISDPNVIFVGQVLTLPSTQPTANFIAPAPAPVQVATADTSTIPVSLPVPQASPAVPVTLPGQGGVASPSTTAFLPSANGQSTTGSATSTASGFNPYVENLLSEVKELRHRNQSSQAVAQPAVEAQTQSVADTASRPAALQTVPASSNAIVTTGSSARNPHLTSANATQTVATIPVSAPIVAPTTTAQPAASPVARAAQPDLVATATLGSENYAPLLQPVTGRLVSPDLPPLPGADSFLPNGSGIFNGYIWPAQGMLTSGYGWRWGRMHQGIDIAADIGTPIHAAADGVVEYAGWNSGGYGNMVEIRHADGSMTRYAHMNAILVQTGQRVSQGEQIGEMGSTGYSTGPHLHFEVHLADQGTVNPMAYLPADR